MAKQMFLWTVLPFGKVTDDVPERGLWRVSVVVSPRLTPEASDEQVLGAFEDWLNWPDRLGEIEFTLRMGPDSVPLLPLTEPDGELWKKLFTPETPVAGFQYEDVSQSNLHSFPVRNVLSFAKRNYGQLAVQSASTHPTLLPWDDAHPDLKGMLGEIGTRTEKMPVSDREIEVALPGFSRFYDRKTDEQMRETVFGPQSIYRVPVPGPDAEEADLPPVATRRRRRALSPDWVNPRPGGPGTPLSSAFDAVLMDEFNSADEYSFYQADRFYRRARPTAAQAAMKYPDYQNVPPPPPVPEYDFHRIVASYAAYPELLRRLGLVLDFAIEESSQIDNRIAAGGGTGVGQIQIETTWASGSAPGDEARPRTAWLARPGRFVPRPRGDDQVAGLLRLENTDDSWASHSDNRNNLFDLYQVDPDGAAIKTVNFTLTAQNLVAKSLSLTQPHGEVTYTTGKRQSVAALRSAGIGVSQHGRAGAVAKDAAAADLKNTEIEKGNSDGIVLFSEDVLRGYRVDVMNVPDIVNTDKWQSLCAREGDYDLIASAEKLDLPSDEGHVSGASTSNDESG
ncbi:MAG: hypothetical protein AAGA05_14085, partial [Pseudomonadota bacterium]